MSMVGILLIATRKYKQFVRPLLEQIDRFFLPKEELTIFLFTDEEFVYGDFDFDFEIKQFMIESYGFPEATLYRYKLFSEHAEEMLHCSHLLYMDVDMEIVAQIGDEIKVDGLLVVRHPGTYATDRWGSPNNSPDSSSWFPEKDRKHYHCGGVQGGNAGKYLTACKILAERIAMDKNRGVMAEWHDETHWNWYTNFFKPELVTELSPSYCIPGKNKEAWGLSGFESKIIAIDKNHSELRS